MTVLRSCNARLAVVVLLDVDESMVFVLEYILTVKSCTYYVCTRQNSVCCADLTRTCFCVTLTMTVIHRT